MFKSALGEVESANVLSAFKHGVKNVPAVNGTSDCKTAGNGMGRRPDENVSAFRYFLLLHLMVHEELMYRDEE